MINFSRKILYLTLGLNLVLLIVVGLLVWQIKKERTELTELINQAFLADSPSGVFSSGSLSKIESQLMTLDSHFLSASTTVSFLEQLESVAKLTKTFLKINQAEVKDDLRLNFSIQGSFTAVYQFLALLEKCPYALRLERLDLRSEEKGTWRGDFAIIVITQKN